MRRYTLVDSHVDTTISMLYFDFTSVILVFCSVLVTCNNFGLHNLITLF